MSALPPHDLPALVAGLLEDHGISQSALARALGVHRLTVHYWVHGRRLPSRQAEERLRELAARPQALANLLADVA